MSIAFAGHRKLPGLEVIVELTDSQLSNGDDSKEMCQKLFGYGNFLISSTGDDELCNDVLGELDSYLCDLASSQKLDSKRDAHALARNVQRTASQKVGRKVLGVTMKEASDYSDSDFIVAGPVAGRHGMELAVYFISWHAITKGKGPLRAGDSYWASGSGWDKVQGEEHGLDGEGPFSFGQIKDPAALLAHSYCMAKIAAKDMFVDRHLQIGIQTLTPAGISTHLLFPDDVNLSGAGIPDFTRRVRLFTGNANGNHGPEEASLVNEFYRILMDQLEGASDFRRMLAAGWVGNPARNRLEALYQESLERAAVPVNALITGNLQEMRKAVKLYHENFK